MSDRQVVPLLYGAGLDRASGVFAVEPRAGRDLRNVYLYRDKAQVRHGHSAVNLLVEEDGVTPLDDVLLVQALQTEQIGLVAGFGADGRVHLFRVGGDGIGLSRIGIAFTLATGAHPPPRLLAAEQYRRVFIAHDEANGTLRAATVYYDPYGVPALKTLQANLDGLGTADVFFRGVASYLTYLVGWGFGTDSDPNHPEVVRVSHPDDPTLLDPDDYFLAGTGGSPVLNCLPAGTAEGSSLLVFKPVEIHGIFGYDKRTFGIRLIESGYGLAGSRLAINLNGVVYFWSAEGPRRSSGGPSEDLAWPLDLDAPSPADLAAAGAVGDGFACYLPDRRCVLFVFGERVYQLSLWDPSALKWSYSELGFAAQCGGVLYSGMDAATTPPTGAASAVALSAPTDTTLHVAWTNNDLTGGEVVEVWLHSITADTWTMVGQAAASGTNQALDLAELAPGTHYEAQVRYRRGPYYRADYEDDDPDNWPHSPGSLSNTEATTITAPVLVSATWSRVSAGVEQVALVWTGNALLESIVYRDLTPLLTLPAGTFTYADQAPTGEQFYDYTVTQQGGDDESAQSNGIQVWTGPYPDVASFDSLISCNSQYWAAWTTSNPDAVLVDHRNVTDNGPWGEDGRTTNPSFSASVVGEIGDTIEVRLRHVETTFGVDDFSPELTGQVVASSDACQ